MKTKKLTIEIVPLSEAESKRQVVSRTITQDDSGCSVSATCPDGTVLECHSDKKYTCQETYRNMSNTGEYQLLGIRCGDEEFSCGDTSGASAIIAKED